MNILNKPARGLRACNEPPMTSLRASARASCLRQREAKAKEIRRVCGYRIGETVEHEGRRVVIDRFPSRKMVIVKPTVKVCGDWNLAKIPVSDLVRVPR